MSEKAERVLCSAAMRRLRWSGVLCLFGGFLVGTTPLLSQAHGPVLLVVNQGDHDVSFIKPGLTPGSRPAETVGVGEVTGHEVAVSPDGRTAFVPIYGNSGVGKPGSDGRSISVLDVPSRRLTGNVDFGHGVRPHCAVFDAARGLLYVTTELDDSVSIIDPRTLQVMGAVPTGQAESHMLAISHDGRWGYTANVGPGTVSVLDLATKKLVTVILVAPVVQRISISTDDRRVFTADQTKPRLAVIDTATKNVASWIQLPSVGYGTASTPDGRWLLVALLETHQVAVIDLATLRVARTMEVTGVPTEVLVQPDGRLAYVSCGKQVAVVDLGTWKVARMIEAGRGADGLGWAR